MNRFSRRGFAAAVIPFSVWVRTARAAEPTVRYEARTTQGKAMLEIYADAVAKMMKAPEGDPTGWLFQWYTHAVRRDRSKATEIARIYAGPSAARDLAQEMWSTCQAHFVPRSQRFFLPWHRMYVYFFERIVRKVSDDPTFTLPYWNYSAPGGNHGVIPPEFTGVGTSLFRSNRNPGVNDGKPIDDGAPDDLKLDALGQGSFLPVDQTEPGFSRLIDGVLHGNVHVDVGDVSNMGDVPWAARDPIFWLHHSNIDRLWESWNRNGGRNPGGSWLTQSFVFADENGQRVSASVNDFADIAKLSYAYDALEPAPPGFQPVLPEALTSRTPPLQTYASGEVPLSATRSRATLTPQPGSAAGLEGRPKTTRAFLVVRNLRANVQPGVLYDLDVEFPMRGVTTSPRRVGVINFFDAVYHAEEKAASESAFVFDITNLAKDLKEKNAWPVAPAVSIASRRQPVSDAKPVVGEVSLYER